jgi:hypothetical protein
LIQIVAKIDSEGIFGNPHSRRFAVRVPCRPQEESNMSMKTIAALWVMVAAASAANGKPVSPPPPAPPVQNIVGSVNAISGFVGTGTDYFAQGNANGTVTWTVPNGQPSGSFDVFTDVYNFSTSAETEVTGTASIPNPSKNFSLSGGTGELMLYEGTYQVGTALSTYTSEGAISFTSAANALVKVLDEGSYFFVLEGITSGAQGGKYDFEVTGVTQASAVPEPGSMTLLVGGVALLGLALRRKVA